MDYQHNFKKKFGQNFLNDENILNKIVKESKIPEDTLVIEIGPGAGALTNKVKDVAKNVLAYEIDLDLQNILIDKFKDTNVTFIWEDFLNRNIKEDIKDYDYSHIFVVANIPYYITTPIVEKIINSGIDVEKVVIMVQKEVGDRFSAKPGNKEYGSISVFLNYYYDIKELFIVSKNCFTPRPNVDSVILSLEKKKDKELTKADVVSAVKFLETYSESILKVQSEFEKNDREYTDYVRSTGLLSNKANSDINKLRKNAEGHKRALIAIADSTYYNMLAYKMRAEFSQAKRVVVKAANHNPRNLKESAKVQLYIDSMYDFCEE